MKIGNTDFNEAAIAKMSFKQFEKSYKNILKGATLKEAFKQLGGKMSHNNDSD